MQGAAGDGDEDVGYFKAVIMSGLSLAVGVWLPILVTGAIYSNNLAIFGEFGRSSNFLFCKYFLVLPTPN